MQESLLNRVTDWIKETQIVTKTAGNPHTVTETGRLLPEGQKQNSWLVTDGRGNYQNSGRILYFSNSGEPVQIVTPVSCSYLTGVVLCCCRISFSFLGSNQSVLTVACLLLGTSLPILFWPLPSTSHFHPHNCCSLDVFSFFGQLSVKGCKWWMAMCENPSRAPCQWMFSVIQIEGNSWLRKNWTWLERLWKTKRRPVEFSKARRRSAGNTPKSPSGPNNHDMLKLSSSCLYHIYIHKCYMCHQVIKRASLIKYPLIGVIHTHAHRGY